MLRTFLVSDQVNSGTNTKINKQLHVKFWFDRKISENSWTDLTLLNGGPGRVVVVERFCTMILPLITEKKQTVKIFFFNVIPSRFFHTKQVLLHHTWMYLILIFWVFTKRMIPWSMSYNFGYILRSTLLAGSLELWTSSIWIETILQMFRSKGYVYHHPTPT